MERKYWLAVVAALMILALACSPAFATTHHTINVDGNMNDWAGDELMEGDNGGDFYVTWDEDNLFIGLGNVNVDDGGVFFVYIDAIPGQGTVTGRNWNGIHTLPFAADFGIAADSGGNLGWLVESSGAWTWNTFPSNNYVGWSGNSNSEFQVPWSEMGDPDAIYVMALFQNQSDNGVTASWPTPNPASGSGSETFTHFYHFPSLVNGISPDDSVLATHILINEFQTKGNERVELYNPTASAFDISGWQVTSSTGFNFTCPDVILTAGGYFDIDTSALHNDGDVLYLRDSSSVLIDSVGFGTLGGAPMPWNNRSAQRTPHGTDTDDDARDWNVRDSAPTFNSPNDAPEVMLGSSLILNEFDNYPAGGSTFPDQVEVYNPYAQDMPLTNWLLADGDAAAPIVTSVSVPAGGWLALVEGVDWTASMDFSGADVGYLFNPDGIRVDQLGWYNEFEDGTFQRICDGEGPNDGYAWGSSGGSITLFDLPPTLGSTNTPGPVDMTITKTGDTSVGPGGLITYVITYEALQPMPTTAISITDFLPTGVDLMSYEAVPLLTELSTAPLSWSAGSRCGFPSGMITITVQVSDTVLPGTDLVNTVEITATGEMTPSNNTDVFTTTVVGLDISVSKTGPADPLRPGDTISYTVSYDLTGTEAALDVVLTDTFPADFEYLTYTAPISLNCAEDVQFPTGVVGLICTATNLAGSGHIIITGTVVAAPAAYVITNTVEITASNDGNAANNSAEYINHLIVPIQEIEEVPIPVEDDTSPYVGQQVWVEGVVTAGSDVFLSGSGGQIRYFVEDPAGGPWSGLYVYKGSTLPAVQEGDWVLLYGKLAEYYGVTELDLTAAGGSQQVVSSGNPLPAAEVLATGVFTPGGAATAEAYESVLIEFQAATVTNDNLGNGEWAFDDGSGETHADNWSSLLTYMPANGDLYAFIRGIGNYSYNEYKLVPRYDADIDLDYLVTFIYHDVEDVAHNGEDVYVAGGFNGWNANANALSADAGYDVFSTTLILNDPDTYDYKYIVKSGGDQSDWLNTGNRQVVVDGPLTVDDYRNVSVGYAHLMNPPAITIELGETTEPISGEVYILNVTDPAGVGRAVWAELGYGTDADPSLWTWAAMDYTGSQHGNNDIYTDTLTPMASGVYSYAVRFDGNRGPGNPNAGWEYADLKGVWPGNPFDVSQAGVLTVTAPNLTIDKTVAPKEDVGLGSVVTFTIVLDNAGDADARGVVVTDVLPVEMDFGGWVQQNGAIQANDILTWTGVVSAGTHVTFVFTATVGTDESLYGQPVINTAYFVSDNAGNGSDDTGFSIVPAPPKVYVYLPIIAKNH